MAGAALTIALLSAMAACASTAPRVTVSDVNRSRAFVDTFDRILIAGFFAPRMTDRGRAIDINIETARFLRALLRSKGGLDVIDAQPIALPDAKEGAFDDTAFWKRIGEEYREPLILTGIVDFRRAGPQFEERSVGPRSVMMWRPRYVLDVRLVFISGRTGDVLDAVSLKEGAIRASDARTSALGIYFAMMDQLAPSLLAALGRRTDTAVIANR